MPVGKCEQDITIIPFGVLNFLKKYTYIKSKLLKFLCSTDSKASSRVPGDILRNPDFLP